MSMLWGLANHPPVNIVIHCVDMVASGQMDKSSKKTNLQGQT